MKKGFLLLGAAAMCATAFAQQQAGWVSADNATVAEAWGWDGSAFAKDKVERPAGTLLIDKGDVTMSTAFVDNCTVSSINKLSLTYYTVNGIDYKSDGAANNVWNGAVGNTNPSAISDLESPSITKGWVLDYYVKKTGYLTLLCQASLNKNIYVFEGVMGPDGVVSNGAMAYEFYAELKEPVADVEGTSVSYKLPADEDGYVDLKSADIDKYVYNGAIMQPYQILMGDPEIKIDSYPATDAAVIFPVYEDCHYYFFATGSKITAGPFIFTEKYPESVSFTKEIKDEDGNVTGEEVYNLVGTKGETGVESIAVELDENAPIYNTLGVRVDANAKGILIQNGKKFIRK